jgi:hypothetical protein
MSDATLAGSDKYRQDTSRKTSPIIEQANAVPILDVLRDFMGIDIPDSGSRSWKDNCPFGFEHPDGGRDKGWRVYPSTNSSYCFVMHGGMTPVRLISLRKDVNSKRAAYIILENYGLLKGRGWRERYAAVASERELKGNSIGSPAVLVEALHSALRVEPKYMERCFETEFAEGLETCLEKLDALLAEHADEEQVRAWFIDSKTRLAAGLQ